MPPFVLSLSKRAPLLPFDKLRANGRPQAVAHPPFVLSLS